MTIVPFVAAVMIVDVVVGTVRDVSALPRIAAPLFGVAANDGSVAMTYLNDVREYRLVAYPTLRFVFAAGMVVAFVPPTAIVRGRVIGPRPRNARTSDGAIDVGVADTTVLFPIIVLPGRFAISVRVTAPGLMTSASGYVPPISEPAPSPIWTALGSELPDVSVWVDWSATGSVVAL